MWLVFSFHSLFTIACIALFNFCDPKEPVPDPTRVMPENFSEEVLDAYLRLPEEALPNTKSHGKFNYTVTNTEGSRLRIEVHLSERRFWVKLDATGNTYKSET